MPNSRLSTGEAGRIKKQRAHHHVVYHLAWVITLSRENQVSVCRKYILLLIPYICPQSIPGKANALLPNQIYFSQMTKVSLPGTVSKM